MKLLVIFLLSTFSTFAQINPLQVKICPGGGRDCKPDLPVTVGNLGILTEIGTCTQLTCKTVSDSQLNNWQPAAIAPNFDGTALQYTIFDQTGIDTLSFAPGTGGLSIFLEYPCPSGKCTFEKASTGTYSFDNALFGDANGGSSDLNWTHTLFIPPPPVTNPPTETCKLVVGFANHGSFGGPWIATAGPGFTMRAQTDGALAVEDATVTTPGLITSSLTWNDYAHWDMGAAIFNMPGGCK